MIVFIIIIHVWCVQLILIIFFFIFFFYSEMKMNPTKTIFNMTEDQEFVKVQWTKKYCDLLPLLICVHKCLHRDFYSVHKAFSLWWKTDYSSLLIFLFLEVFIYCTYRLQNVWHSLHYDSIMPSNLYLVINTKFCGYIY